MSQAVIASIPGEVARTRTLIGAWAVVSIVQYFLAEAVVIAAWAGPRPYSRAFNHISDLGAAHCGIHGGRPVCSPLHAVMNASFILQGAGMIVGAALVSAAVLGLAAKRAPHAPAPRHAWLALTRWLIAAAGVGTILVGIAPEDALPPVHIAGAAVFFVAGGSALITIGWAWRTLHWSGWVLFAAGLVSLVSTVVFVVRQDIAPGAVERLMAYPITIGLAVVGFRVAVGVHRARSHAKAVARQAATSMSFPQQGNG